MALPPVCGNQNISIVQMRDASPIKGHSEKENVENPVPLSLFEACLAEKKVNEAGDWVGEAGPLPALTSEEIKGVDAFLSKKLRFRPIMLSALAKEHRKTVEIILEQITNICRRRRIPVPFVVEGDELFLDTEFSLKELYQIIESRCGSFSKKYCTTGGAVPGFLGAGWYARAFQGTDPQFFAHIDARIPVDYDQSIKVGRAEDVDAVSGEIERYFISKMALSFDVDEEMKMMFRALLTSCFLFDGGLMFDRGFSHLWRFLDSEGIKYDINIEHKSEKCRLLHLHDLILDVSPIVKGNDDPCIIPESDYKNGWQAAFDLSSGVLNSDVLSRRSSYVWGRYISFVTRGNYCWKREVEEGFAEEASKLGGREALKLVRKMVSDHHFGDPVALVAFTFNLCAIRGNHFTIAQKRELWRHVAGDIPKTVPFHPMLKMAQLLGEGILSFDDAAAVLAVGAYGHLFLFGSGDTVDMPQKNIHPYPTIVFRDRKQPILIQLNMDVDEAMARVEKLQGIAEVARLLSGLQMEFSVLNRKDVFFGCAIAPQTDFSVWMNDPSSMMFLFRYGLIFSSGEMDGGKRKLLLCALPDVLSCMADESKKKIFLDRLVKQTGVHCSFEKVLAAPADVKIISDALIVDICEGDTADFDLAYSIWNERAYLTDEKYGSTIILFRKALSISADKALRVAIKMGKRGGGTSEEAIQAFGRIIEAYPMKAWGPNESALGLELVNALLKKMAGSKTEKLIFKSFFSPFISKICIFVGEEKAYKLLILALEKQMLIKWDTAFQQAAVLCCEYTLRREGGGVVLAADLWKRIERRTGMDALFVPACTGLMIEIAETAAAQMLLALSDEFLERVNESSCGKEFIPRYQVLVKDHLKRLQSLEQTTDIESLLNSGKVRLSDEESVGYRITIGNGALAKGELRSGYEHLIKLFEAQGEINTLLPATQVRYRSFACAVINQLLVVNGDIKRMQWGISQLGGLLAHPIIYSLIGDEGLFSIRMRSLVVVSKVGVHACQSFAEECVSYVCKNLPENPQAECELGTVLSDMYGFVGQRSLSVNLKDIEQISERLILAMAKLKDVDSLIDYFIMLNTRKINVALSDQTVSMLCVCPFNNADRKKVNAFLRLANIVRYFPQTMKSEPFRRFFFGFVPTLIESNLEGYIFFTKKLIEILQVSETKDIACELIEQTFAACEHLANGENLNAACRIFSTLWPAIEKSHDLLHSFPIDSVNKNICRLVARPKRVSKAISFMKNLEVVHAGHTGKFLGVAKTLCAVALEKNNVTQCLSIVQLVHKAVPSCNNDPLWMENLEQIFFYLFVSKWNYVEVLELIPLCPIMSVEDWILIFEKFNSSSTSMHDKIIDIYIKAKPVIMEDEPLGDQFFIGICDLALKSSPKTQNSILELFAHNLPSMPCMQNTVVYTKIAELLALSKDHQADASAILRLVEVIDEFFVSQDAFTCLPLHKRLPFFEMYLRSGEPILMCKGISKLIVELIRNTNLLHGDHLVVCLEKYFDLYKKQEVDSALIISSYKSCLFGVLDAFHKGNLSIPVFCRFVEFGIANYPDQLDEEIIRAFDHISGRCYVNRNIDISDHIEKLLSYSIGRTYNEYVLTKLLSVQQIFSEDKRMEIWGKFLIKAMDKAAKAIGKPELIRETFIMACTYFVMIERNHKLVNACMQAALKALVTFSISGVAFDEVLDFLNELIHMYSRSVTARYEDPVGVVVMQGRPFGVTIESAVRVEFSDHINDSSLRRVQRQYFDYMDFFVKEMLKERGLSKECTMQQLKIVFLILDRLANGYGIRKNGLIIKSEEISQLIHSTIYSGAFFEYDDVFTEFLSKTDELIALCLHLNVFASNQKELYVCMLMISKKTFIFGPVRDDQLLLYYNVLFRHLAEQNRSCSIEHLLHIIFHRDLKQFLIAKSELGKNILVNFLDILVDMPKNNVQLYDVADEPSVDSVKIPLIRVIANYITQKNSHFLYDDGTKEGRSRAKEIILKYFAVLGKLYEMQHPLINGDFSATVNPVSCAVDILQFSNRVGLFDDSPQDYFAALSQIDFILLTWIVESGNEDVYLKVENLLFKMFAVEVANPFNLHSVIVWNFMRKAVEYPNINAWKCMFKLLKKILSHDRENKTSIFFDNYTDYINFVESTFLNTALYLTSESNNNSGHDIFVCRTVMEMLMTDLPNGSAPTFEMREKRARAIVTWIGVYNFGLSTLNSTLKQQGLLSMEQAKNKGVFKEFPEILEKLVAGLVYYH